MTPETTFLVACLGSCLFLVAVIATLFRRHHIAVGREELADDLFRQYRDDPNEVTEWLCRGAIVQLRSEFRDENEAEIASLRCRLLHITSRTK